MSDSELATAAATVTIRLGDLTGVLRALGSRVGVGELIHAHRALDAIDAASRADARLALRAVLCANRADLERFELAFVAVFGDGRPPSADNPLSELGAIERAALPSMGMPDTGGAAADPDAEPVPAAWSTVELLREKDFARYTTGEMIAARDLIARLARRYPTRISRRTRTSRRR
ncbi:MAG: hypothetical protein M3Y09_10570, partial [Actinomycetota bacterium]|nr:hypothetical protein [Actinomycetota bacterium]